MHAQYVCAFTHHLFGEINSKIWPFWRKFYHRIRTFARLGFLEYLCFPYSSYFKTTIWASCSFSFLTFLLKLKIESVSWIQTGQICWWWFDFRFTTISTISPAALENNAQFNRGQNWLKNNHLPFLIWKCDTVSRSFVHSETYFLPFYI